MKVREVLGVDFCGDRLRVVELRREEASDRAVLTRWASRTVPAGAESATAAAALRRLLDEGGFAARAAVLGLPRGRGFLRCRASDLAPTEEFPQIDYITDGRVTPDGREVLGIASRADVTRLVEIAAQAELNLLAVELRAMGCIKALGLSGSRAAPEMTAAGDPPASQRGAARQGGAIQPRREGPEAEPPAREAAALGLIVGEADVTLALVDGGAILSVQTRSRGAVSGRLDRWEDALAAAEQMARLVEMAHPESPAGSVRVIVNDADRQAARSFSGRLHLPVELVSPGADAGFGNDGEGFTEPAEYAAALGLALEGMEERVVAAGRGRRVVAGGGLNFLQPGTLSPRRRALSRRHVAATVAGAVLIVLAVAIGLGVRRQAKLSGLEARYDQLAGKLQQWRQTQQRLRVLGPWLDRAESGQRTAHRQIYEAMSELFPSQDAYVRRAVLEPGQDGRGPKVRLEGRTRASQVLHEFVSRLNRSALFARASLGPVVDDSEESSFPKRFSVTFSLREGR